MKRRTRFGCCIFFLRLLNWVLLLCRLIRVVLFISLLLWMKNKNVFFPWLSDSLSGSPFHSVFHISFISCYFVFLCCSTFVNFNGRFIAQSLKTRRRAALSMFFNGKSFAGWHFIMLDIGMDFWFTSFML